MFVFNRYEGDNFVLDEQVVRAALKSYQNLQSARDPSASLLSPSSYYLRLLLKGSGGLPSHADSSWKDPAFAVLLLEWRAALIIQERARNQSSPDASSNQRVSKAVTEAYVATQVAQMIQNLELLDKEKRVVADLYHLVSEPTLMNACSKANVRSSTSSRR